MPYQPPIQPVRLLLVDDEPDARALFRRLIEGAFINAEVEEAVDGVTAMAVFPEFLPHLVVLDIDMPRMDGFEVCRRIFQIDVAERVSVLAISGRLTEEFREKMIDLGAIATLSKPFTGRNFTEALQKLCPGLVSKPKAKDKGGESSTG